MQIRKYMKHSYGKLLTRGLPLGQRLVSSANNDYNNLKKGKIDLINSCFQYDKNISSFADLGGVWEVDGGYTFYILSNYNIQKAYLVDSCISHLSFLESKKYPQLMLYEYDFGSDEVVKKISGVDLVLLFDVLLHQVNPDWNEIIDKYALITDYFAIYHPQFNAENTVRLLDLGKEEYFKQIPHEPTQTFKYSLLFTNREEEVRDTTSVWQYGITNNDLRNKLETLGFKEVYFSEGERWGNSRFTDRGFLFKKTGSLKEPMGT